MNKDQIIADNQKVVIYTARKWSGRGVDFLDLVQEGNIGLLKAIERFDETRGVPFPYYAQQWVKKYIREAALKQGNSVSVPMHVHTDRNRQRKLNRKIYALFGYEMQEPERITSEELQEHTSVIEVDFGDPFVSKKLECAYGNLKWREVVVLKLRFIDGLTLETTGECIGLTRERVRQIEKDGISTIRQVLNIA